MSVSCVSKDCDVHYRNHIWGNNPDLIRVADQKDRGLWERDCGPWESGVSQVRFCIKMCKLSRFGRFFGVFSKSFALFYLGIDLVFTYFIGFKLLCKGPRDVSMRRTVFNTWQLTASRESHCVDRAVAFTSRFHISEMFLSKILTVFAVSCLNVNAKFI